jgi:HEAT repeat protein
MTSYCLECFAECGPDDRICPSCGRELDPSERSYERKLILALSHRLPDRRLMAARILGERRSRAAVPALERLALAGDDPYLQAEAARALRTIDPGNEVAGRLAVSGPILTRAVQRPDATR